MFNMARGVIPYKAFVKPLPWWKKPIGHMIFKSWSKGKKYDFVEGYNLETAKMVKPVIGGTALLLVGGMRTLAVMEEIITQGHVDFISMARPFIREPNLVERIRNGQASGVSCTSCNNCAAALFAGLPTRCYARGLPFMPPT
jgi:2,4-dienoyl-CoA reductase-like NADH-dependent reductase (Old Yellow Enzyme family)